MSDVAVAMNVFFKNKRPSTTTPRSSGVRERLESMDSSSSEPNIHKIFERQEKAEKNRTNILTNKVRALSQQDELRLQKVEAVNHALDKRAERINDSQTRAAKNRERLLSERSDKLKRRHTLIDSYVNGNKRDEVEARTQLSVVFERRGRVTEHKRQERLKNVVRKARDCNIRVAQAIEKAKEEERKKSDELREQWEEKIERAREKRQQLLQQKAGGM